VTRSQMIGRPILIDYRRFARQVWDLASGELLYSITLASGGSLIHPYTTDDGRVRMLVGSDAAPYTVNVVDHADRCIIAGFAGQGSERLVLVSETCVNDHPVFITVSESIIRLWDRGDVHLIDTVSMGEGMWVLCALPYLHPRGRPMLVLAEGVQGFFLFDLVDRTCRPATEQPDGVVLAMDIYATAGSGAEGPSDRLFVGTRGGGVVLYSLPRLTPLWTLAEVRPC
jgi:hypothetical protein